VGGARGRVGGKGVGRVYIRISATRTSGAPASSPWRAQGLVQQLHEEEGVGFLGSALACPRKGRGVTAAARGKVCGGGGGGSGGTCLGSTVVSSPLPLAIAIARAQG